MLDDESKTSIEETSIYLAHLIPSMRDRQDQLDGIRYAVEKNKPLFIVKKAGYTGLDDVVAKAIIAGIVEFEGEELSREHLAAQDEALALMSMTVDYDVPLNIAGLIIKEENIRDSYAIKNYSEN